jgi:hypothetical protein
MADNDMACRTDGCDGVIPEYARGANHCYACNAVETAKEQMPLTLAAHPELFTHEMCWNTGGWCMTLGVAFKHEGRPDGSYTMLNEPDEEWVLVCLYDEEDEEGTVLYQGHDVEKAVKALLSGEAEPPATAVVGVELSSCCNAPVSYYGDGGLYCKGCFGDVVWVSE